MSALPPWLLPCSVIVVATVIGWLAQARVRRSDPSRDTGAFWARILWWVVGGLGVACWISAALESFPSVWVTGRHLHVDRIRFEWWVYPVALFGPLLVWAAVVGMTVSWKSAPNDGRWVAGTIGRPASRLWLLAGTPVPLLLVTVGWARLNQGPTGFPAATWTTLVLLVVTLVCLALSTGDELEAPQIAEEPLPDDDERPQLPDWPDAMRANGIELREVVSWQPRPSSRRHMAPGAADLAGTVDPSGIRGIAPELVDLMARVLASRNPVRGQQAALVLAPDGCGQVEVLAYAARELFLAGSDATLVITPRADPEFGPQIERWLSDRSEGGVSSLDVDGEMPPEKSFVWIVDVQTLSDRFIELLRTDARTDRIGQVVWWGVEAYTGVLAANAWAISRRFQRLMLKRRPDVRNIIFARDAPSAEAQMSAFVRRVLPYQVPDEARVRVEQGPVREIKVYRLAGHAARFNRVPDQWPPAGRRHPTLVAALASLETGWPTFFESRSAVQNEDQHDVLESRRSTALGRYLVSSASESGARIRPVDAGEVLSLSEILGQGGRASPEGLAHHVGITISDNPYVRFVVRQMQERGGAALGAKRLVAAKSQANIIERHLLAALRECPDVGSKLLKTFLLEGEVVRQTLDRLHALGRLSRDEVRFLSEGGPEDPVPDYFYRNLLPAPERQPLDTVGTNLIEVRDPSVANAEDRGARMRVDPERVTIQAYPDRVFMAQGERYRIHDWTPEKLRSKGWIECQREDRVLQTWRKREASLTRLRVRGGHVPVDFRPIRDVRLTRTFVDVLYDEIITGHVKVECTDLTTGTRRLTVSDPRSPIHMAEPFSTSAMLLGFDPVQERTPLFALALALTYVVPVHIGVEQDALEVLPIWKAPLERYPASGEAGLTPGHLDHVSGVAIVDLYPRGIGLVDALEDDEALLVDILGRTRDWLLECIGNSEEEVVDSLITQSNFTGVNPAEAVPLLVGALGNSAVAATGAPAPVEV